MTKFVSLALCLAPVWALMADEIPAERFGHLPVVEQPTVSIDGKHVAAVLNTGEIPVVVVGAFASKDLDAILRLEAADDRVEWIQWANAERLLVSASFSFYRDGERYRVHRLYAVDLDGQNLLSLNQQSAHGQLALDSSIYADRVISILPGDPDHILLQAYDRADNATAVFKVNINNGESAKQFDNEYGVRSWHADASGVVRLGIGYSNDLRDIWNLDAETDQWEKLYDLGSPDGETFEVVFVDGDKAIVESDRDLGRNAVWQFDIPSGKFDSLLFAADGHDVDHVILNAQKTKVIGAAVTEHFQEQHYFDEADKKVRALVSEAFPQYRTKISSRSSDSTRLIVAAERDNKPIRYFWLDLESKRGGPWFSQYPGLNNESLSKITPVSFPASDGTPLHGYVTLPEAIAGDSVPLVVLPHDGPQSRDDQEFNPYVQFMASRGFAVLQVNFRGSTGFGSDFMQSGFGEWGQGMQRDIYDAINWVKLQGFTKAERVCIVGVGYGGYVALAAAFQRPDRFDCIVSVAGPSNLIDQVESFAPNEAMRMQALKRIGDPDQAEQRVKLVENSPVFRVGEMTSPILLVHGSHDAHVKVRQSREFYRVARAAGVDIEYIELDSGTHNLDENSSRLALFRALDGFLKKHLN